MSKHRSLRRSGFLQEVGQPIFWGLVATTIFYGVVLAVLPGISAVSELSAFLSRYFAGHIVEYVETALFFIGVSVLLRKFFSLGCERIALNQATFLGEEEQDIPVEKVGEFLAKIKEWPEDIRSSAIGRRIESSLGYIQQVGSASGLEDHLRYLGESEESRQQESYSLVRIFIWATPMLGFLGTVVGITLSLGNLSPVALVENPEMAMEGLLGGLGVAFDTTAVALSLSILLMFGLFLVERLESEILQEVESSASRQLVGLFEILGSEQDPIVRSIEQMGKSLQRSSQNLLEQQVQLWQASLHEAQSYWNTLAEKGGEHLTRSLTEVLAENRKQHILEMNGSVNQWNNVTQDYQESLVSQQQAIADQTTVLRRAVEATGEVLKLESALNRNLEQLVGTGKLEEATNSLTSAIHLLHSKLQTTTQQVQLQPESNGAQEQEAA
ncbi:MAG: MotA/TolQ/ExbB proton channel family protein [Pirellulaceae bacterium]|nr:MotA/TolQ/ExbB proton channel family protein [Pirellulaceae bacterium]